MTSPIDIARQQLARSRNRSTQRDISAAQQQAESQLSGTATYLGYTASTGQHRAQLPDGTIAEGDYISTSGLAPGDRVAYVRSSGGVFFKAMPR